MHVSFLMYLAFYSKSNLGVPDWQAGTVTHQIGMRQDIANQRGRMCVCSKAAEWPKKQDEYPLQISAGEFGGGGRGGDWKIERSTTSSSEALISLQSSVTWKKAGG